MRTENGRSMFENPERHYPSCAALSAYRTLDGPDLCDCELEDAILAIEDEARRYLAATEEGTP